MEHLELCYSWIFQTSGGALVPAVQTQTMIHITGQAAAMHYFTEVRFESFQSNAVEISGDMPCSAKDTYAEEAPGGASSTPLYLVPSTTQQIS